MALINFEAENKPRFESGKKENKSCNIGHVRWRAQPGNALYKGYCWEI